MKSADATNVETSDQTVSDQDISQLMSQAIEEKKKTKFDKMIERGSKIAAQQQEQVMNQLVSNSI